VEAIHGEILEGIVETGITGTDTGEAFFDQNTRLDQGVNV
jgi:hypothetical protein